MLGMYDPEGSSGGKGYEKRMTERTRRHHPNTSASGLEFENQEFEVS